MKTLLLLSLVLSGTAFGQTNVIAAKSHASASIIDKNDCDNFGDPIEQRSIESVKYLNDNCLVEVYNLLWVNDQKQFDTICDHPFLTPGQIDVERIKAMYPDKTEFIGFDQLDQQTDMKKLKKERRKQKKSSSSLIFLFSGIALFLIYLFTPKKTLSQS